MNHKMKISSLAITLSFALVASMGCALKTASAPASSEPVEEGSDALQSESDSEALGGSLAQGGHDGAVGLASAAELLGRAGSELSLKDAKLGDVAKGFYKPSTCLTVTDDPATKTATYVFNGCSGPYGLAHITGTVAVGYAAASGVLTLKYASTGLMLNKSTIDWNATAVITGNGAARDMVWDGKFSGTTGRGRAFARTNHKELKWTAGTDCVSVSGESDGTVTGHELRTDVINYNRCKHACPESGSEIKVTDLTTSKVYDVRWNAADVTYTGPEGRAITFKPICAD